jgi:hypothetical protein
MKVTVKPHEKGVWPAWFWVGVGLGCSALLGLAIKVLPAALVPPCGFRLVTGHPCPTCGMTRMWFLLLSGQISDAFRMNPFLFVLLGVLGAWVAVGGTFRLAGRDLFVEVPAREERWWWALLALGFLANWAYLWVRGI